MLMNTNDDPLNNVSEKSFGCDVGIKNVDYDALKRLNLRHGTSFQDADGGQRGSFEHVSFQTSTLDFDDKYSMRGRFAFDVDELPIPKNGDHHSHTENDLGTMRVHAEESPVEDSEDTGQSLLFSQEWSSC